MATTSRSSSSEPAGSTVAPARRLSLVRPPRIAPAVSVVLVCRDDEEQVGHSARRLARHLDALGLPHELLVVDELSADNTLSLVTLLRHELPSLAPIAGAQPGRGFVVGARRASAPALLLVDARSEAPLSNVGWALDRLRDQDVVAVHCRYVALHRTRALRAFDALDHRRDPLDLEERLLRRARSLGLRVEVGAKAPAEPPWQRLSRAVLLPFAAVARR